MVFLAVAREGLESVFFLLAIFQQSPDALAPLGALLGIAWSPAPRLRHLCRQRAASTCAASSAGRASSSSWSPPASSPARCARCTRPGLWNHLQATAFDLSGVLPVDSGIGTLLSGLFGYSDRPAVGEVIVYLLFLAVTLYLFLADPRATSAACHTSSRKAEPGMSGSANPAAAARMQLALAGSALLVVLAGAAFYYASVARGTARPQPTRLTVTIAGKVCDPNALTVPAGRRTFKIVNQSDRAVEWEILDGVMVVAERENIAPGITQTLTAKLVPGKYEITCGLLSNPRGTLTVTQSAEAAAEAARPPMTSFIGPWRDISSTWCSARRPSSTRRAASPMQSRPEISAGHGSSIFRHGSPTRRSSPLPLVSATSPRRSTARPTISRSGSRIPSSRASIGSNMGCSAPATLQQLAPAADALLADVTELQGRIAKLQPAPDQPLTAVSALLASIAQARVPHGADRYAGSDLPVLAAEIENGGKVVELFRPLLSKANPALMTEVGDRLAAVQTTLAGYRQQDDYVAYDKLDQAARATLAKQIQDLADFGGEDQPGARSRLTAPLR